ncbi:hypothetical protein MMC07_002469 [Pseudocyphellaria aurata]|nr:hypothetical protein [Pseudocyphellaria aurata]
MARLPLELWSLVVGEVYHSGPGQLKDLRALCLVSRDMHDVTAAWLYRRIRLDLNDPKAFQLMAERMTSKTASHVRDCITSSPGVVGFQDSQLELLRSLIPKLSSLRRFKWDHRMWIPNSLLEDLNHIDTLQKLELGYHITLGSGPLLPISALKNNTKLTSLALHIRRVGNSFPDLNYYESRSMILQAPALKSLTISTEERDPRLAPTDLLFFPDQSLPQLETLVLENYALGEGSPHEIENRLDITKLQTLCLRRVNLESLNVFISNLFGTRQTNLKYFCIQKCKCYGTAFSNQERWPNTLTCFLESVAGLETLILYGDCAFRLPPTNAITKHGKTLKRLKIHSSEAAKVLPTNPELGFTAEKLQAISILCPYLVELAIDLDRDEQTNELLESIQKCLGNFTSLRRLEIFTPLCRDDMCLLSPFVDQQYVEELGTRVRSPKLDHLTVWVGDDEKFALFDKNLPEQLRWENRHKVGWHVQYSSQSSDLNIWENGQKRRSRMLTVLAGFVGLHQSPPQDWDEYKAWVNELGDAVQDQIRKLTRERQIRGDQPLVRMLLDFGRFV